MIYINNNSRVIRLKFCSIYKQKIIAQFKIDEFRMSAAAYRVLRIAYVPNSVYPMDIIDHRLYSIRKQRNLYLTGNTVSATVTPAPDKGSFSKGCLHWEQNVLNTDCRRSNIVHRN